jgi:hemoglobin/transferrin/lactoferrin receptor protein
MKLISTILTIYLITIQVTLYSQNTNDTIKSIELDEVIISATRFEQKALKVPELVKILSKTDLENQSSTNMGDILSNSGSLFVQKSQMGGGSPVIRGFEANKILLYIDGVRMNNAIYRAGHLQNIITLDNNQLEKVEILFGASGLIYGSDALGGVLSFVTARPRLSDDDKLFMNNILTTRYSSANNEKTIHFRNSTGFKKLGFLTSLTYSDFGDLLTGSQRSKKYPGFGERTFYVKRTNGTDSTVININPDLQVGTAYKQADFMEKILFKTSDHWSGIMNVQYSTSSKIPRYDRLTETTNGLPSYSEWYYGPQNRLMVSFENELSYPGGFFDKATLIGSYQQIEEDRISRRFRNKNEKHQEENLDIWGFTADFEKNLRKNQQFQYGFDFQLNNVNSIAYNLDITDNFFRTPGTTRYPNGGSKMVYMGIYSLYQMDISKKLRFSGGIRYNHVILQSIFINSAFPFSEINLNPSAICGNSGIIYHQNSWKVALNAGKGFRCPNIDDIAKIFDSSKGNIIVPNSNLRPENTYNIDFNINKYFPGQSYITLAVYQTWIKNVIVTREGTYNGMDSAVYDGVLSNVQVLSNSDKGLIRGFQFYSHFNIGSGFYSDASLQYTYGRDLTNDVPLDHIPPLYGKAFTGYRVEKIKAEIWTVFNGWKRIGNYSPSGEDNAIYATADGMPAWATINTRFEYTFNRIVRLQFAVENIMNIHYRQFASGVSAPGRNLIITLRIKI